MEAIREEKEASYDFFGRLIDEHDVAFVSKFMEDMMPNKLFCRKPDFNELWVFWSHESIDSEHTSTNLGIQDRIKIPLSKFYGFDAGLPYHWFKIPDVLVQFWAAEMIGGQRHLTTTLQPFALNKLTNEKLREYRKHCVGYKFLVANVENDGDLSMDGIVGRVFRNQLPECCKDLNNYSVRDYPHRDLALSCGINSSYVFPLFEADSFGGVVGCVGVLELLYTTTSDYPGDLYFYSVNTRLKEVGLRTKDMTEIKSQIDDLYKGPIQKEIKAALKQVCITYDVSLAITWVSYGRNMSCKDSPEIFQGELLVPSPAMSIFPPTVTMETYFRSALLTLRQGLAEKAFLYNNLYFCRDVSKLSMSDHLLAQMAGKLRLESCFIVCLRNISTGKHEFVIKFLQHKTYSGDLVTMFSSILARMKQQLKNFEVVTDPQDEIFIEVDELGESFVKPMKSEGERIPTEYSWQSLHSTEFTLNSTCRKAVGPSWNRRNRVNESDQAKQESSFSVNECAQRADLGNGFKDLDESEQSSFGNSETASTNSVKLFRYRISVNQPHSPIPNQRTRTEYSHFDGPISDASAVVAHNVAPFTSVSNVEWVTIKVCYRKDIIKFDVPPLSSMADLMENVITRWGFLKDMAFVIKYLDDSNEPLELKLLATDTDLKECMFRTRSRGEKVIKTVIELQDDAQDLP